MTELTEMSLVAVAEAIAGGEASSREVTEACLARIDARQPVLNAFISLDRDEALPLLADLLRIPPCEDCPAPSTGTRAPKSCRPTRTRRWLAPTPFRSRREPPEPVSTLIQCRTRGMALINSFSPTTTPRHASGCRWVPKWR